MANAEAPREYVVEELLYAVNMLKSPSRNHIQTAIYQTQATTLLKVLGRIDAKETE